MQGTSTLIVLRGLSGNVPTHLKGIQVFLAPHVEVLEMLWWVIAVCTLSFLLYKNIIHPLMHRKSVRSIDKGDRASEN